VSANPTIASARSDSSRNPLLEVRDLRVHLGSSSRPVRAVDGVSFSIARGETLALLGESGCGKSMTALSILRLLPAGGRFVDGGILLDGVDLLRLRESQMRQQRGRRIAMIFQEPQTALNPVLSIGFQIGEVLRCHHMRTTPAAVRQRVLELLDAVGIPDPRRRFDEYPHQLSGGMKQRVMIAMALAGEPALLVADEPTTALDVTIQAQVLELLRTVTRQSGMSMLLITHDLGVVAEMADRVAVMYAGQLVEVAARESFFRSPLHPYSRKLFASLPDPRRRDRPLAVIGGMVPPLTTGFTGCRFESRCELRTPSCAMTVPGWHGSAGHRVRCHLHADGVVSLPAGADQSSPAGDSTVAGNPATGLVVRELKVHFPIEQGLLKRTAGYVYAVDGISLDIPPGQTLALVGESGCGKTTAGKAIARLIEPTAGAVTFDGTELQQLRGESLRRMRRDIQFIFQDPYASMNPRMTILDIVAEGLIAQGMVGEASARRRRVVELLGQVGLDAGACERYPHEFSGGQRQRICIARALAVEPRLIICDEPTSALDVSVQAQILNLLQSLQRQFGLSYLFITHNLAVVQYLAHQVAVMYLGRIVEHGSVESVFGGMRHPYTRALLSAAPRIDGVGDVAKLALEGELPSPSAPPTGCHFHPRCPLAEAQCRSVYPAERSVVPGHFVRCHLAVGAASG
jgi:peptide/nickel transport system ATP-binding protein